jgi:hypothetical protein
MKHTSLWNSRLQKSGGVVGQWQWIEEEEQTDLTKIQNKKKNVQSNHQTILTLHNIITEMNTNK